ncbi:unnamed protein product, partial [Nesidiocoris tenuis]
MSSPCEQDLKIPNHLTPVSRLLMKSCTRSRLVEQHRDHEFLVELKWGASPICANWMSGTRTTSVQPTEGTMEVLCVIYAPLVILFMIMFFLQVKGTQNSHGTHCGIRHTRSVGNYNAVNTDARSDKCNHYFTTEV